MFRYIKTFGVLTAGSFVLLFAATVTAETAVEPQIARTVVGSTGLSWQPTVSYKSATLTVSGPGELNLRREFATNESLSFHTYDSKEAALEDGQYTWELRFSPVTDQKVKEALRAARESGNTTEIDTLKKQGKLPGEPLVISGYFRVKDGSVVTDSNEPAVRRGGERIVASASAGAVDTDSGVPTKDQLILDDLIVSGSACIGFDCVNGESFGFDTIRIKENNLRIRAVDTSSTSSFPTRDWQITFNDSANGGASKFSIDDIDGGRTPFTIEASARSHSLYVDDRGMVGFGTSTPAVELHMSDGDTPTVRLDQNGTSGWSPQRWDVAGNEANFFIRDATNGSKLPFRIRPGAPTSSIDIGGDGDVGIGTSLPSASLHVKRSDGTAQVLVEEINGTTNLRTQVRIVNNGSISTQYETGAATWRQQFQDNAYTLTKDGTGGNEMTIFAGSGDMTIRGSITTGGPSCGTGCDAVLRPDFPIESIEDHAVAMWAAGYLPAIGPTVPHQPTNISEKLGGVLNELEKAHIYIEQLHERLAEQEDLRTIQASDEQELRQKLAAQEDRLNRLEALLNEKNIE